MKLLFLLGVFLAHQSLGVSAMNPDEAAVAERALEFAKRNKKSIARRLTSIEQFPSEERPVSVFMAGSPGAGKTEASKALIQNFQENILRIDADELREEFEGYDGHNAWLFQAAASVLVEKIHDFALKQSQSFMLDGTLAKVDKAEHNIERSLKKGRHVQILYVYQEPLRAWEFVQAREAVEGRRILLDDFIAQYFGARQCVNSLKAVFGKAIHVDLLLQNRDNSPRVYKANIDLIDNHVPEKYDPTSLAKLLSSY